MASFKINFSRSVGGPKLTLFQKMYDFWAPNDSRKKFSIEALGPRCGFIRLRSHQHFRKEIRLLAFNLIEKSSAPCWTPTGPILEPAVDSVPLVTKKKIAFFGSAFGVPEHNLPRFMFCI